jgi:hypothetical protein
MRSLTPPWVLTSKNSLSLRSRHPTYIHWSWSLTCLEWVNRFTIRLHTNEEYLSTTPQDRPSTESHWSDQGWIRLLYQFLTYIPSPVYSRYSLAHGSMLYVRFRTFSKLHHIALCR